MRRTGLFSSISLLKMNIFRIRHLSTEDEFPALRIANVGSSLFILSVYSKTFQSSAQRIRFLWHRGL
jgi:hypothetical protein